MLKNKLLLTNRGASAIAVIFWLLFLAAAAYTALKVSPPYISYYMLKTDVENDVMKNAHLYSDADVEKLILAKAHSWSVPITHDDVVITRFMETISVQIKWNEIIDINDLYKRTVYFNITEEAPLKAGQYGLH